MDSCNKKIKYSEINEIIPGLYISDVYTAESKAALTKYKITHIVTVANYKPVYPTEYQYMTIDVDDVQSEDLKKYFKTCIKFID